MLKLLLLAGATQPKSMLHWQQWHLNCWHVMACQLTAVLAPLKAWHGLTAGAHHKRTRSICRATRSIGIQDAAACFVLVSSVADLHSIKRLILGTFAPEWVMLYSHVRHGGLIRNITFNSGCCCDRRYAENLFWKLKTENLLLCVTWLSTQLPDATS